MDTISMNSENSKASKPHVSIFKLIDKLDLRRSEKNSLWNLSIYYTCKNMNRSNNNNQFKISAPTWNYKFDLPDGSYSLLHIQDYFQFKIT